MINVKKRKWDINEMIIKRTRSLSACVLIKYTVLCVLTTKNCVNHRCTWFSVVETKGTKDRKWNYFVTNRCKVDYYLKHTASPPVVEVLFLPRTWASTKWELVVMWFDVRAANTGRLDSAENLISITWLYQSPSSACVYLARSEQQAETGPNQSSIVWRLLKHSNHPHWTLFWVSQTQTVLLFNLNPPTSLQTAWIFVCRISSQDDLLPNKTSTELISSSRWLVWSVAWCECFVWCTHCTSILRVCAVAHPWLEFLWYDNSYGFMTL